MGLITAMALLGHLLWQSSPPFAMAWIAPLPTRSSNHHVTRGSSRLGMSSSAAEDDFASFAASLQDSSNDVSFASSSSSKASASVSASSVSSQKLSNNTPKKKKNNSPQQQQQAATTTWQEDLDELLDPMTTIARRQTLLRMLMSENAEIRASVQAALQKRTIDPLLTPTGKKIQDGTRAVARQLTTDILPSLVSQATSSSSPLPLPLLRPPPLPPPDQVSKVGTRLLTAFSNQVQAGLQTLQQDLQDPVNNIPVRVAQQGQLALDTAANLVKETPNNLPEPAYAVVDTTDDYEIRDYEGYTVACTNILEPVYEADNDDDDETGNGNSDSSYYYSPDTSFGPTGAAYNSLVAYLLGANQQQQVLELTTPVTTTMTGEMRVYLAPTGAAAGATSGDDSASFPEPLKQEKSRNIFQQGTIRVQHIPPARLAVRRFTGFCTGGEVERQKEALLAALNVDDDGNGIMYELDVAHGQTVGHVLFQYNPPYTIPVMRRNEIAVPIMVTSSSSSSSSSYSGVVDDIDSRVASVNGSSNDAAAPTASVNGASLADSWVSP